jgi:3-hydroxyisobutyrate dehydrogenase and related beta-hydroxyacid dehydrogenases
MTRLKIGFEETGMANNTQKIGWIGMGRMGLPMAERLLKAGHDVSIWNRTRAKAEPLAKAGGKIVDKLADLAGCDVVFSIVSTERTSKRSISASTASCTAATASCRPFSSTARPSRSMNPPPSASG